MSVFFFALFKEHYKLVFLLISHIFLINDAKIYKTCIPVVSSSKSYSNENSTSWTITNEDDHVFYFQRI